MKLFGVLVLFLAVSLSSCEKINKLLFANKIEDDASLTVPQLIEKNGYPVEVHHVQTSDGYILEMHRIPYGRAGVADSAANRPVVFVQHGIFLSSAAWVITGPQKGLGYLLADLGYDVWLGNARGNTYSRKHTSLSPTQAKFWDFSWHEIGVYDVPAMIDYALAAANQSQVFYIGHGQGTTVFYVMCSELPEYNNKIRAQFSLAPLAYMSHVTNPLLNFLAHFRGPLSDLLRLIGVNEFLPSSELLASIGGTLCDESSVTQLLCTNPLFVMCGFNLKQMNTELLPIIMGHTPAGASTKQVLHYAQLTNMLVGKFRQYYYGSVKNLIKYGSLNPPKYDLTKITAPVALFYSRNDWLASEIDVLKLYEELANPIGRFLNRDSTFTHLDYLWGTDVDTLVYNYVFRLMSKY